MMVKTQEENKSDNMKTNTKNHKSKRKKRRNSVSDSVKDQLQELISAFESIVDDIPVKNLKKEASKLKSKVNDERKKLIKILKKRQKAVSDKFKQKSTEFRVNVQKSIRTAITGNPNRSIRRHIQEPPQIKLMDKLSFTLSLVTLIMAQLFLLSYPQLFQYFYSLILILLMIARYIDYKQKHYEYFLIDFCYFVNFLAILHIFFFSHSNWLFEILFVLSNGPVLFAIIVWRNSMVLHSVDKMTSLFIHLFPPFYTYTYKWLDIYSRVRVNSTYLSLSAWLFYPNVMYLSWQFAYLFKTEVISKDYLDNNPETETSLRWLARHNQNSTNRLALSICNKLGIMKKDEKFNAKQLKTKIVFVAMNYLYFNVTVLPTWPLFTYKYVQLGTLLFTVLCSIWQGANYYIEVFSERYSDSLEKKAKELEEKYLFIDENLDRFLEKQWKDVSVSDISDIDYDTSDDSNDFEKIDSPKKID